jgi:hypothetical protein
MSFDWRNVKVVEVTPSPASKGTEPFAIMPLAAAARVAKATKTAARMFVWIWIVHQTAKRKSEWVVVSKGTLARYGISKKTKKVALAQLEEAGLIAVKRQPGKATAVNLMRRPR